MGLPAESTGVLARPAASHSDLLRAADQRVVLHGVPWQLYEALVDHRGESAVPRLTYLEGELELMTPSNNHELDKKKLARLLEAWSEEAEVELEGVGSWTIKKRLAERGLEPDECYFVGMPEGTIGEDIMAPDLAIEVVWTSGGISKLEVYRGLGVREVWFWKGQRLSFHVLEENEYREAQRSRALPDLDPDLLIRAMQQPTQTAAVRWLRKKMRAPSERT